MEKLVSKLFEFLAYIPFVMVAGAKHPDRRIQFNWPDFLRVLAGAVMAVIMVNGWLYMESRGTKKDITSIQALLMDNNIKLNKMCDDTEVYRRMMENRITTLEARQAERIERERAKGIRK